MKKKTLVFAAVTAAFAGAAHAQSSVTLYGIVDAGLTYVSNEVSRQSTITQNGLSGGKAAVGLTSGNVQQSRWGLRGVEDLGGGLKTIFNLESGFNVANGTTVNSALFNRQAFVGLSHSDYGTLTLGRQYDSVVDYLGPLSATGTWGGTYFAHPGDNDNLNSSFSLSNTVKYQSPIFAGFSANALYGFSNSTGFADNRAYSFGAGYEYAGFKFGAAYLQLQGLNSGNANGSVQDLPTFNTANLPGLQNQRTWGVGGNYAFGPAVVGLLFTQTRLQDQIANISLRYNNFEVNGKYNFTPAFSLGAEYAYTQGLRNTPASGTSNNLSAHWNQFGLQADYALSRRTDLYGEAVAFVGANNQVGFNVVQVNGTAAPSTSRSQVVVSGGIRHRF
ncbi:Outer membrane porin protein [Paraburkholderia caffeinitolerans]|uniref:Outer membrane porin protein n=1 Tax=Paraburkholderia caffeinitolerans TaxID=1723730 RepID=A0A6J5FVH7_9BURK|nr:MULTISPECIES: porin [Paraburkholderia]CAB3787532.1 Outer membrane porin protein [Paraburkholderia caffeinitolerans]